MYLRTCRHICCFAGQCKFQLCHFVLNFHPKKNVLAHVFVCSVLPFTHTGQGLVYTAHTLYSHVNNL